MSKMSKENNNEVRMLTLSLPLVELENNQAYDINNYPCNGTFFVKADDGTWHISNVNIGEGNILCNPLPPVVGNMFAKDIGVQDVKETVKDLIKTVKDMILEKIEYNTELLLKNFHQDLALILSLEESLEEKLCRIKELLEQTPKDAPTTQMQGCISETVLLDIIRSIK